MEQATNQILLRGTLHEMPSYSHENHGIQFHRFYLNVPRLSGTSDILPVIAEEAVLSKLSLKKGLPLCVTGQIHSHNIRSDGKRHLLIFVFACAVIQESCESENLCLLEGVLCREPTLRRTPLGREICDIMLAVPRSFRRADYLPCILWGKIAREAAQCQVRDRIRLTGRLQSRIYTKQTDAGPEKRTAYEVSVLEAAIIPE